MCQNWGDGWFSSKPPCKTGCPQKHAANIFLKPSPRQSSMSRTGSAWSASSSLCGAAGALKGGVAGLGGWGFVWGLGCPLLFPSFLVVRCVGCYNLGFGAQCSL